MPDDFTVEQTRSFLIALRRRGFFIVYAYPDEASNEHERVLRTDDSKRLEKLSVDLSAALKEIGRLG
jgi:hypothetical protein